MLKPCPAFSWFRSPDAAPDIYVWPYDLEPHFEDGWGYSNGPPTIAGAIALLKAANPALTGSDT